MTRTLFDSVTVADLPGATKMLGAYRDGHYANVTAAVTRFPKALIVTITPTGKPGAHVVDCETGDVSPEGAVTWARDEVKAGRKPTIYCNASTWPTVKLIAKDFGIENQVSYWIAHYDGDPTIPAGAVAKQYASPDGTGRGKISGHYDVSSVADYWPGVDPVPVPKKTNLSVSGRRKIRRWRKTSNAAERYLASRGRPFSDPARSKVNAAETASKHAVTAANRAKEIR